MRTRKEIQTSLDNNNERDRETKTFRSINGPMRTERNWMTEDEAMVEILLDIRDLLDFRSRGGKKRASNLSKKRMKEIATKASHSRKIYKDKQKGL